MAWYLDEEGCLIMDKLLVVFIDFYRWNFEFWLECFIYKEVGY